MVMVLSRPARRSAPTAASSLVDTKYELGKTSTGEIVVIDEIHTPDSSRFWMQSTYDERMKSGLDPEPLDSDFVRRYYTALDYRGDGEPRRSRTTSAVGARRSHRGLRAHHGTTFEANTEPPLPRIAKNLGLST